MRRFLAVALVFPMALLAVPAADTPDTAKAAATRKLLKEKKITLEIKELGLAEALDEIKDQVKGVTFLIDTKGGVSRNQKVSYSGKDVTIEVALDGLLKKNDLGYYVITKEKSYDGSIRIVKGKA